MKAICSLSNDVVDFENTYVKSIAGRHISNTRLINVTGTPSSRISSDRQLTGWWSSEKQIYPMSALPNPWVDHNAVSLFERFAWKITACIGDELTVRLNKIHNVAKPPVYWRTLFEPWLLYLVSGALDRFFFCRVVNRVLPECEIEVGCDSCQPKATMASSWDWMLTRSGHLAIVSDFFRFAKPLPNLQEMRNTNLYIGNFPGTRRSTLQTLNNLSRAACLTIESRLLSLRKRSLVVVGQNPLGVGGALQLWRAFPGIQTVNNPHGVEKKLSREKIASVDQRKHLTNMKSEDPYVSVIMSILPNVVPCSLVENYSSLVIKSKKYYGESCTTVVGNYSANDLQNQFIGESRASGCRVAFAQHGGFYLQGQVHGQSRLELQPDTLFLSWGRSERFGKSVMPTPSPVLLRIRDSHQEGKKTLMVEGTFPPAPYVCRFESVPLANLSHISSDHMVSFVDATDAKVRRGLQLKPFPGSEYSDERNPLLTQLIPRHFRFGVPAKKLMRKAKITILFYPDTPLIEAMTIGTPVIGIWSKEHWHMRSDAKEVMDELESAKIIFSDPIKAAEHLNAIYSDVTSWWHQPAVKNAREHFLNRFAIKDDWKKAWVERLELLTLPQI